jgi:ATP-binding cassette subfamily B protein
MSAPSDADARRGHLRRALAYLVPYRGSLAAIVGLSLIGTGLALAVPYLSKLLIDEALVGRDTAALLRIVGMFVALTFLTFGLNVASGLLYTRVSAAVLFDMRLDLYRHLQRLSPRFWARTPLGDVVSRVNNDIGEIQRIAADAVLGWIGHVLFLVGAVVAMAWLDWRLLLASLVVLPPALWALVRYRDRLEGSVRAMRERSAAVGSFLIETLQGMRLVTGANAQEREAARFRAHNDAFVGSLMLMQRLRYLAGGLPGLLLSMGTAIVFVYGGLRVIGGAMTLGTLVAFMAYQMRLLGPVQGMMGLYSGLATARVSLARVHELMAVPPEVVEPEAPVALPTARGELALERVSFGFGRGEPTLLDVSFIVGAGETVALVGASGSGKSTIADLLVRQLDPETGTLRLDGHDVRTLALADLRRHVAVVEQEPFLLHASLAENVRYARPDASDAAVGEAIDAAGLGELVGSWPLGAATVVGERGRALSGGERQRVALARALLADPAVLVLDEATAFLDSATEARVIEGWEAVRRGRTIVLISHRLDVARRADRVVVLRDGRVVEEGTPDELIARGGPFDDLFTAHAPALA